METLDTALTYAIDLVMAFGGLYIGTAFVAHMVDRWNKLEVKPKVKASQEVKIPLTLKASEAVPLEFEQVQASVAKMPIEPMVPPVAPMAEMRINEPSILKEPDRPVITEPSELQTSVPQVNKTIDEPVDEPVIEPVIDPVIELTNESINEPINEPINESTSESTSEPIDELTSEPVDEAKTSETSSDRPVIAEPPKPQPLDLKMTDRTDTKLTDIKSSPVPSEETKIDTDLDEDLLV